jgi:anti-anti-sigma regulatory factor
MEITVSKEQGRVPVTVLKVAGQLDGQTYQELIDRAREEYEAGARSMLLDLGDLTYISSAGLVSLHSIALLMRGQPMPDQEHGWNRLKTMDDAQDGGVQQNFKLLNPRPEVNSVLEMVGFSAFFEVFTDRQKAIDSF